MNARKLGRLLCRQMSSVLRFVSGAGGMLVVVFLFGRLMTTIADPAPTSFALGGLQFRNEPRISMVKENLTISNDDEEEASVNTDETITVDYDFQNNTDRNVSIVMAFPVPVDVCGAMNSPYMAFTEDGGGNRRTPFHVWVGGVEVKYSTEARAFQGAKFIPTSSTNLGKEYTGLLRSLDIDPDSCDADPTLPEATKAKLVSLGLLDGEDFKASWTLRRKYYWTQTFPANKTIHIRISYPPGVGHTEFYLGKGWDKRIVQATSPLQNKEFRDTCSGVALQGKLSSQIDRPDGLIGFYWVDFILVTANYWSGPIQDFTLTVDNTYAPDRNVSFCWNGPIQHPDATHVIATAHNFSPQRNLHIGYFQVY
jgi:hypothetical protein